ncbi:MAG: phosphoribosylanthranilate isomerase [Rickettsiales bacterium]|jgi:phosphoribosylanthranilate isomerase
MKIKTKLCGFTTKKTVDLAVECGANFIGFVFYPASKRNISPQNAGEISKDIPKEIKKVAVIVNPSDEDIIQIIKYLKPDFLQIHNKDLTRILEIKKQFNLPIIKAFAISEEKDLEKIKDYEQIADYFLFDAKVAEIGGSGKSFDWNILCNLKTNKNWFLSGGLNINNIEIALKNTNSTMVDLSSGIEETKGVKSPKLISGFMNKLASIDL